MEAIDSQDTFDFASVFEAAKLSGDGTIPYVEHAPIIDDRALLESIDRRTAVAHKCFVRPVHPSDDPIMRDIARDTKMKLVLVIINGKTIARCPIRDMPTLQNPPQRVARKNSAPKRSKVH